MQRKANPVNLVSFQVPFGEYELKGDSYRSGCEAIVLHGAGKSSRMRFVRLRELLNDRGIPSSSFDFIGHGETGGDISESTLHGRTDQAAAVIRHTCIEPLTLIAASMSGYTAIKLTEIFSVSNLILMVPAVYTHRAYDLPFGSEFSTAIRTPGSWKDSDAFSIMSEFKGNLLVIAAEVDDVIPAEVIEGIYGSAINARSRHLHIVPNSRHSPLFPKEQDFLFVLNMITETCQNGRHNKQHMDANSSSVHSRW